MSSTDPHSEKTSEEIEKSIPTLSEYYKSLDPAVKQQYLEKISAVGLDPAALWLLRN